MKKKPSKKDSKLHKEVMEIFRDGWKHKMGGDAGPTDPDSNGCWANVVKEYEREFMFPLVR